MTVFGVDSAGKTAGAAILQDGALLYECYLCAGLTHSETLLRLIDGAFCATGLGVPDVDVFAAAAGPGSFTGLRIGLAAVKGLALPGNTPCAGVSTLEALAYSAGGEGTLLAALDARRGQVYWAAFAVFGGAPVRLSPDVCGLAAEAAAFAEAQPGPVWLCGDGAPLLERLVPRARCVPADRRLGRAAGVCRAAEAHGETVPPARLVPDYHRLSEAQRTRAERLQKEGQG